ncbi:hypothetical protein Ctha_0390 [Chloroherpeton thalassium ATCC 35110]|uniref:Outer membrane efflux protein n=1 Tax=Chloroherpeton thalassium (strain ATCC 35110 / GB-78) TaxID=517418 RepID=B3QU63_CHLT3|nr:TolC family protein [Chloroherpeton thalassium]ACF12861.1 hypothetical protein Ctha_0390 [Chloroherpeton thalassium ATCC 35110]
MFKILIVWLTIALLEVPSVLFAQSQTLKTELDSTDKKIIDSLVIQVFRHSYDIEALREEHIQEKERIIQEKMSWLGSFRFGIQFLNYENSSEANQSAQVNFVPAFGLTLNLDLEGLFTLPSRVRLAEAGARRVEDEIMKRKRTLRIWVEEKYQQYTQMLSAMQLKQEILASQEEQARLALERFQRGEGQIEGYIDAMNAVSQTREAILELRFSSEQIYREISIVSGQFEDLNNLMFRE